MSIRKTKFRWYGKGCRYIPFAFLANGRFIVGTRSSVDKLQDLKRKNECVRKKLKKETEHE